MCVWVNNTKIYGVRKIAGKSDKTHPDNKQTKLK